MPGESHFLSDSQKGLGSIAFVTPRLDVREFEATDVEARYLATLNDTAYMGYSNQRFQRHTADSVAAYRTGLRQQGSQLLACRRMDSNVVVGTIAVRYATHHDVIDLGLMVLKDSAGKGFGVEAWNGVFQHIRKRRLCRKVTAGTLSVNEAMRKIIEGSGMSLEGTLVAQERYSGGVADILLYGALIDDR